MRILLIFLLLFYLTKPVFAADPPILTSPSNNSTISSIPTFSWQAVSGSTGYNILIDDEPTVTSPYAKTPYYPTNPSYSPQTLNPGTYYWKVKAKDSSGNWGSFSSIWSFTLANSTSTPSPTPTSTPTPITTTSTSSSPISSFTISGSPSQINSDQSFSVSVGLSLPNNPSTTFYLKGAFKTSDGSNYFGKTLVSGSWVKNGSTYSNQLAITTDSSGNWSGNLEVKPDAEDSGFTGSGDYIFKVGRYTSSGSGPTWSNEVSIKIVAKGVEIDQGGVTDLSGLSPSKSSSVLGESSKKLQDLPEVVYSLENYKKTSTASGQKFSSPSANIKVANQKQTNLFIWIGSLFVVVGIGSLGFIIYKNKMKI